MTEAAEHHPILLAGAGPAGITAAHALDALALPFRWIAPADTLGGTLLRVGNPLLNWPGPPMPDGPSLVSSFRMGLDQRGLSPEPGRIKALLGHTDHPPEVLLDDGQRLHPPFVLLCTGTRPRLLDLPHEREHLGSTIEISVNRTRHRHAGKVVAVVGGGDAALEGALILADCCPEVHLIHRRTTWRAQQRFIDQVTHTPHIHVHTPDEVTAIASSADTLTLSLSSGERLTVGALFVRIGVEAALPHGIPPAILDSHGYLSTDPGGRTGWEGLLAAGDVTGRHHQSVAWATGSANRAVETILRDGGWKSAGAGA